MCTSSRSLLADDVHAQQPQVVALEEQFQKPATRRRKGGPVGLALYQARPRHIRHAILLQRLLAGRADHTDFRDGVRCPVR